MNPHPFFLYPFFSTHFMLLVSGTLRLNLFLEHTLHILPSLRQRTQHAHVLSSSLFQERINLFIYAFPLRPDIQRNLGFYNSSNGESY